MLCRPLMITGACIGRHLHQQVATKMGLEVKLSCMPIIVKLLSEALPVSEHTGFVNIDRHGNTS